MYNLLYSKVGELAAFFSCIIYFISLISLMGLLSQHLSSQLEEVMGVAVHKTILQLFGLTPFLDTYPDLLAATLVSLPAVILATGIKV